MYRVTPGGTYETFAENLGIACGLAFGRDGTLYVGDRSGTVFGVAPDGSATSIATLPASVAAFHLAVGPDDQLYVTGPTLGPYDHVYKINPRTRELSDMYRGFGRPQGLAVDAIGTVSDPMSVQLTPSADWYALIVLPSRWIFIHIGAFPIVPNVLVVMDPVDIRR